MKKALFKDINIIDFLQQVVNNNTIVYATDFKYDKQTLLNTIGGENFFWLSRSTGTCLVNEEEVYILDTVESNMWTNYNKKNDSVEAFFISVNKVVDGVVLGNVLEIDYEKHIDYISKHSEVAKEVLITFKDDVKFFDISEYRNKLYWLGETYGPILSTKYIPRMQERFEQSVKKAREMFMQDVKEQKVEDFIIDLKEKHDINNDDEVIDDTLER